MFAERRANSLGKRRRRQLWSADRPFKILALDGGGIKGVYTAEVMRLCEEAFGKKLSAVFDMIAGTSTGGIIALGLGLGLSAEEIAAFYRDDSRNISSITVALSSKAPSVISSWSRFGSRPASSRRQACGQRPA
jgi:patatin-like phospholipase/acyl hydrolase